MARIKKSVEQKPLHYLLEWREFRKMTQEQLAGLVDTTKSVISLIEASARPSEGRPGRKLSPKWAARLAPHLRTSPGFLIDHDPNNLPTHILDIWAKIPEEARPQAEQILETFMKKVKG